MVIDKHSHIIEFNELATFPSREDSIHKKVIQALNETNRNMTSSWTFDKDLSSLHSDPIFMPKEFLQQRGFEIIMVFLAVSLLHTIILSLFKKYNPAAKNLEHWRESCQVLNMIVNIFFRNIRDTLPLFPSISCCFLGIHYQPMGSFCHFRGRASWLSNMVYHHWYFHNKRTSHHAYASHEFRMCGFYKYQLLQRTSLLHCIFLWCGRNLIRSTSSDEYL